MKRYKDIPGYSSWLNMNQRCSNQKNPGYKNYGGRGISICERWRSFPNFLEDMGERPDDTSLDRIDVNGNYEPSNCRWTDISTQNHNRRRMSAKTSIHTGVYWYESYGKYGSHIYYMGTHLFLGYFFKADEAIDAYTHVERQLYG